MIRGYPGDLGHKEKSMKKWAILLSVAFIITFSGCTFFSGSDGKIYGEYSFASGSTMSYFSLGGFPYGIIYTNTYYAITPGTYNVVYRILYDSLYYPGNSGTYGNGSANSGYYWHATYTVKANSGSLFWKDGDDKYFRLYLNRNSGLELSSGDATIGSTYAANTVGSPFLDLAPTSSNWTSDDGSVTVTVTSKIVQLTDEELKALPAQTAIIK